MGNCISGGGRTRRGHRGDAALSVLVDSSHHSGSPSHAATSGRRSESAGSPQLANLSSRRSSSAASFASPNRIGHSSLELPLGYASPGTQRLNEYISLLEGLKKAGVSTEHPQVKALDAELQPRLIEALNAKYPGIGLSLFEVKEREHSELRKALIATPDGGKWRAVVNTTSASGFSRNMIEHTVAVEAAHQGGRLSIVILESLAVDDRCTNLVDAAKFIKTGVSIVLTEAQRGYAGCRIHALHNAVQMFKNQAAMDDLHAQNFAVVESENYNRYREPTFTKVRPGVEFLPAGFFKHVTSRKTFDRLPESVKNSVNERFFRNYVPVTNVHDDKTIESSISIDEKRIRYAKLALQN